MKTEIKTYAPEIPVDREARAGSRYRGMVSGVFYFLERGKAMEGKVRVKFNEMMDQFVVEAEELPELKAKEFRAHTATLLEGVFELLRIIIESNDGKLILLADRVRELIAIHPEHHFREGLPKGVDLVDTPSLFERGIAQGKETGLTKM